MMLAVRQPSVCSPRNTFAPRIIKTTRTTSARRVVKADEEGHGGAQCAAVRRCRPELHP
jgi:hypothetical protein